MCLSAAHPIENELIWPPERVSPDQPYLRHRIRQPPCERHATAARNLCTAQHCGMKTAPDRVVRLVVLAVRPARPVVLPGQHQDRSILQHLQQKRF